MSSDDSDEEFTPFIPGQAVPTSSAVVVGTPDADDDEQQPLQKARLEKHEEGANESLHEVAEVKVMGQKEEISQTAVDLWERYVQQGFPAAALYERGFIHTSSSSSSTDAATHAQLLSGSPRPIHDIAVLNDSLGAVICTIDSIGAVRLWRKLPRGLFILGESNCIFAHDGGVYGEPSEDDASREGKNSSNGVHGGVSPARNPDEGISIRFYVRVDSDMQWLLFIAVETLIAGPLSQVTSAVVNVEVCKMNPTTLTIEARTSVSFRAPVVTTAAAAVSPAVVVSGFTSQPFLLQRKYEPHIAFFTAIAAPPGQSWTPLGNGVILFPCFPHDGSASITRVLRPTRLSVAGLTVSCVQLPSGSHHVQGGTSLPCVLVDAQGIIDYATIESCVDSSNSVAEADGVISGLTLQVTGGLAMCPPASPAARTWRCWITFSRRHQTGFFSALKDLNAKASSTSAAVGSVPCGVAFTVSGAFFVSVCLRVLLEGTSTYSSHTSDSVIAHVTQCIYVFHFASGKLCGKHEEAVGTCRLRAEQGKGPVTVEQLKLYLAAVAQRSAVDVHVEEVLLRPSTSPSGGGGSGGGGVDLFILVPELTDMHLTTLFSDRQNDSSGEAMEATSSSSGVVRGRMVRVYHARITSLAAAAGDACAATMHRLAHAVGETELYVRAGPHQLPGAASPTDNDSALPQQEHTLAFSHALLTRSLGLSAPMVLLRRVVSPSQNLKNIISRSAVGKALAPEELKKLFEVPSQSALAIDAQRSGYGSSISSSLTGADPLILTTALRALSSSAPSLCTPALLVYGHHISDTTCVFSIARFVSKAREPAAAPPADSPLSIPLLLEQAQAWASLLEDLGKQRDFKCGELLGGAAAVAARHKEQENATSSQQEAAAAGGAKKFEGAEETGAEDASASTALGVTEDDRVRVMLAAKLPHLFPLSPAPALTTRGKTLRQLECFIHIRGHGTVRVHFLPEVAPLAVENFTRLARRGYYNALTLHRVIPGAIVQGGCPHGDGTGGESAFEGGAAFKDEGTELFPFFSHTREHTWLCMANAGKDTNGSQFFFTAPGGEPMPWLNGCHTVFGYVVSGAEVVKGVGEVRRDKEDKPLSPVVMERVDVIGNM